MTVNQYLSALYTLLKNYPEIGNLQIVYCQDDEGNSYQKVQFTPSLVKTEGLENQYVEVIIEVDSDEIDVEKTALCIN